VQEAVITSAARTAIGKFGGTLADMPAVQLGTVAVGEALRRADVSPDDVDEVIMGQVLQAGSGLNAARQVALSVGLPVATPAYTVNKVCASGMKAVALGAQAIAAGESRVVVAGGMENMSAAPFLLGGARWGYRLGHQEAVDSIQRDALEDPLERCHMGMTAENLAAQYAIDRQAQDEFAASSQHKAAAAVEAGRFEAEIVPLEVPQGKGKSVLFNRDQFIRPETTTAALGALQPAFKQDGTVTAGNASGINDGAAALVLMSAAEARRRGAQPLARIAACASAGVEPAAMGIGPVPATRLALERAELALGDIDIVELNEAFAAQSLAVITELGLDPDGVNVNGGAIALGHPVGCSGARILVTLLHAMAAREARLGLATLCVGGGQGMAVVVERTAEAG